MGFVLLRGLHHTKRIALFPRPSLWAYALWVLRATFLVGCSLWAVPECYRFLQSFAYRESLLRSCGLDSNLWVLSDTQSDSVGFLPRIQSFFR